MKNEISLSHYGVNEERDKFKSLWLDAEDKAETWERRYNNLLPLTQVSFEE